MTLLSVTLATRVLSPMVQPSARSARATITPHLELRPADYVLLEHPPHPLALRALRRARIVPLASIRPICGQDA